MKIISLYKQIRLVSKICNKSTHLWGFASLVTSLALFLIDLVFAFFLQKFFFSIGLIKNQLDFIFFNQITSPIEIGFFLFFGHSSKKFYFKSYSSYLLFSSFLSQLA